MSLKRDLRILVESMMESSVEIPTPKSSSEFSAYCDMKKIHPKLAFQIWELAKKYGTWDLAAIMAKPPTPRQIQKTKDAVEDMLDTAEWSQSEVGQKWIK